MIPITFETHNEFFRWFFRNGIKTLCREWIRKHSIIHHHDAPPCCSTNFPSGFLWPPEIWQPVLGVTHLLYFYGMVCYSLGVVCQDHHAPQYPNSVIFWCCHGSCLYQQKLLIAAITSRLNSIFLLLCQTCLHSINCCEVMWLRKVIRWQLTHKSMLIQWHRMLCVVDNKSWK